MFVGSPFLDHRAPSAGVAKQIIVSPERHRAMHLHLRVLVNTVQTLSTTTYTTLQPIDEGMGHAIGDIRLAAARYLCLYPEGSSDISFARKRTYVAVQIDSMKNVGICFEYYASCAGDLYYSAENAGIKLNRPTD